MTKKEIQEAMNKKQKIDYINKVNERFINAHNHGNNGNNWWYPRANMIAYNVKLYGRSMTIDDIREFMTKRQNDYYSDDMLYELCDEEQVRQARMFSDDIDEMYKVKSHYAGRSGGWLEVEYNNPLEEAVESMSAQDINNLYCEAQELEALEAKIATYIAKSLKSYQKYLNTTEYCRDIVNVMMSDEDLGELYKGKIKSLTDKLK